MITGGLLRKGKRLFPALQFDLEEGVAATSREDDFRALDEEVGKIPFSSTFHWRAGHPVRGIFAGVLKTLSRIGIMRWLCGYRYVLAPTNIFMVGTLPVLGRGDVNRQEPSPARHYGTS
jgi:hypothetical protein